MSNKTIGLTDELHAYVLANGAREPEILKRLRDETAQLPNHQMQIAPEQGAFMALLVRLLGARRYLEIGTFTGYSSLAVALALSDDGHLTCCDVSTEWTDVARRYWTDAGVADRVDLRIAPAVETLDALLGEGAEGTYDFAFIDADKSNYLHYYERALKLVRSGGLISIDNTLWYGKPADPAVNDADTEAIREVNRRVHSDARVTMSLVPIGDGLTLALKS